LLWASDLLAADELGLAKDGKARLNRGSRLINKFRFQADTRFACYRLPLSLVRDSATAMVPPGGGGEFSVSPNPSLRLR